VFDALEKPEQTCFFIEVTVIGKRVRELEENFRIRRRFNSQGLPLCLGDGFWPTARATEKSDAPYARKWPLKQHADDVSPSHTT
jgi:hypothetical protein